MTTDASFEMQESYLDTLTPEGFYNSGVRAQKWGFDIITGKPDVLLLDIDSQEDWVALHAKLSSTPSKLSERLGVVVTSCCWWNSKSIDHKHVAIKIEGSFSAAERSVLQLFLHSDPKRELLTARRAPCTPEPHRLFRPKSAVLFHVAADFPLFRPDVAVYGTTEISADLPL